MLGKWLGRLSILLGGLIILTQFTLIPLAEKNLTQALCDLTGSQATVKIDTFPPWKLLHGRIDELVWQVEGLKSQELSLEHLEGHFTQVEISWWEIWQQKNLNYSFKEPGEVIVVLTEANLQQYLGQHISAPIEELRIAVNGQKVELTGNLPIAGQKLPLLLIGHLQLEGSDALRLVPEKIQLGNFALGGEIQERLIGNAVFQLPVSSLPLKIEMYEIKGREGKIIFKGRTFSKVRGTQKNGG